MLPFALHGYHTFVLPIEVEIPSLRILAKAKLEEAEWVRTHYDQLNLVEEKRLTTLYHRLYVVRKVFPRGAMILSNMDGEDLLHPLNSDAIKKTMTIRKEICEIHQHSGETLHKYWERFNKLCTTCSHHQINEQLLL
ncbi:hypothetical protein CR513_16770, partial [Mucuna pruriens]